VELHDLGAVHEALAPVGDEALLIVAPPAQPVGPLAGPAHVERLVAGVDHGAVHDPRYDRGQLTGCHRHHGLVEEVAGRGGAPGPQ
jgi:hypothetical protein